MEHSERFFVITGGPGSGKSTLIDALEARGYARSIEAGRELIQDQVEIGGNALPWRNPAFFADLMLSWEMRSYRIAQRSSGLVFFDRGVPDIAGYLRLMNLTVPAHVVKAAEIFRTTGKYSSPHRGPRSSSKIASASRISMNLSAHAKRWL